MVLFVLKGESLSIRDTYLTLSDKAMWCLGFASLLSGVGEEVGRDTGETRLAMNCSLLMLDSE